MPHQLKYNKFTDINGLKPQSYKNQNRLKEELKTNQLKAKIMATTDHEELKTLWERGAGLCTSWCILISSFIYPALDNYFGQQGRYRAAFSRNGIIIDSSAYEALWAKSDREKITGKKDQQWFMTGIKTENPQCFP